MDLNVLIESVKNAVGAIIEKPKMTEKLLVKPPFRFLHDTITAIIKKTGFGEGLFNEIESDSAAVTDKDAKLAYLQKIFNLVGICQGKPLAVSAMKVIAGHEPENTNIFLLSLAEVAMNGSINSISAVQRTLNGELPGQGPIPLAQVLKFDNAEAKGEGGSFAESKSRTSVAEKIQAKDISRVDDAIESNISVESDRGKSRGGTRGGRPSRQSTDDGISRNVLPADLDAEIAKCDGQVSSTQTLLGDVITRPKLTDNLLSKPPFKYLFDIIMEVQRVTGFSNGLYTNEEMNKDVITNDKNMKLIFLEKIIKLIGHHLNTLVDAQPMKIIAGQDPAKTNKMLQLLAIAAKHLPDSTATVRAVLDDSVKGNDDLASADQKSLSTSRPLQAATRDSKPSEPSEVKAPTGSLPVKNEIQSNSSVNEDPEAKPSARPSTARRRPPKVKEETIDVNVKNNQKKAEGILIDGQIDDDDDIIAESKRLADDLGSNTDGTKVVDAQSKLVKDILSRQAEHEATEKHSTEKTEDKEENKGGGIRIGKLRKSGMDKKTTIAPGNSTTNQLSTSSAAASFGESEVEKLRNAIQLLVKHTGPLGSCMDFIQEDIGLMSNELHKWEDQCRIDEALLESEKMKTKSMLQPLYNELSEMDERIADQLAKISALKASIAKDDERIQNSLKLIIS